MTNKSEYGNIYIIIYNMGALSFFISIVIHCYHMLSSYHSNNCRHVFRMVLPSSAVLLCITVLLSLQKFIAWMFEAFKKMSLSADPKFQSHAGR